MPIKSPLDTDLWLSVSGSETLLDALGQKHGPVLEKGWSLGLLSASAEVGYLTHGCVKRPTSVDCALKHSSNVWLI